MNAEEREWPPKIEITLDGAIRLWARARNCPVTKDDCDDLAEAVRLLLVPPGTVAVEVDLLREAKEQFEFYDGRVTIKNHDKELIERLAALIAEGETK